VATRCESSGVKCEPQPKASCFRQRLSDRYGHVCAPTEVECEALRAERSAEAINEVGACEWLDPRSF